SNDTPQLAAWVFGVESEHSLGLVLDGVDDGDAVCLLRDRGGIRVKHDGGWCSVPGWGGVKADLLGYRLGHGGALGSGDQRGLIEDCDQHVSLLACLRGQIIRGVSTNTSSQRRRSIRVATATVTSRHRRDLSHEQG